MTITLKWLVEKPDSFQYRREENKNKKVALTNIIAYLQRGKENNSIMVNISRVIY